MQCLTALVNRGPLAQAPVSVPGANTQQPPTLVVARATHARRARSQPLAVGAAGAERIQWDLLSSDTLTAAQARQAAAAAVAAAAVGG
jgi:hypothetical protein